MRAAALALVLVACSSEPPLSSSALSADATTPATDGGASPRPLRILDELDGGHEQESVDALVELELDAGQDDAPALELDAGQDAQALELDAGQDATGPHECGGAWIDCDGEPVNGCEHYVAGGDCELLFGAGFRCSNCGGELLCVCAAGAPDEPSANASCVFRCD